MIKDLTDRANTALDRARALAKQYGDACCATGHVIFGLTSDHLSVGNRIFHDINIYPEMFRDHLKKLPRQPTAGNSAGLHPLVVEAIKRSRKARQKLGGGRETTTDHLLVALLSLDKGTAYVSRSSRSSPTRSRPRSSRHWASASRTARTGKGRATGQSNWAERVRCPVGTRLATRELHGATAV